MGRETLERRRVWRPAALALAAAAWAGCAPVEPHDRPGEGGATCDPFPAGAATVERVLLAHRIRVPQPAADGAVLGLDLDGTDAARCGRPDRIGVLPGDLRGVDLELPGIALMASLFDQHFRRRARAGRGAILVRVTEALGFPEACPRVEIAGAVYLGDVPLPLEQDGSLPPGIPYAPLPPTDPEHTAWTAREVRLTASGDLEVLLGDVDVPTRATGDVRLPWPVRDARVRLPRGGTDGPFLLSGGLDIDRTARMLIETGVLDARVVVALLQDGADLAPDDAGACRHVSTALTGDLIPADWVPFPGG